MTHDEALELLELTSAEAADAKRVRQAHERRRQILHRQYEAATAAPVRAAYAEAIDAINVAVTILLARAMPSPVAKSPPKPAAAPARPTVAVPASPPPRPKRPPVPVAAGAAAPGTASSDHPVPFNDPPEPPPEGDVSDDHLSEWIAATPWGAIRNEASGEFHAVEEPRAPRGRDSVSAGRRGPKPVGRVAMPAMQTAIEPVHTRRPAVTQEISPAAPHEATRPVVATRLRTISDPPRRRVGRRIFGTMLALLIIAGIVATGAWAWQAGKVRGLMAMFEPEPAGPQPFSDTPVSPPADAPPPIGVSTTTLPAAEPEEETEPAAVPEEASDPEPEPEPPAISPAQLALRAEIERLAVELTEVTGRLGVKPGLDVETRLAAAEEASSPEPQLQSLEATLRKRLADARAAATGREQLNQVTLPDVDSPLTGSAGERVAELSAAAEKSVAAGEFATAATEYEQARQAATRLAEELASVEAARADATDARAQLVEALKALPGATDSPLATSLAAEAHALAPEGAVARNWIAGEISGRDTIAAYRERQSGFTELQQQLAQVAELQTQVRARQQALADVQAEIAGMDDVPVELAEALEQRSDAPATQPGFATLQAETVASAVEAARARATDIEERLKTATQLRDLLARRSDVLAQLDETAQASNQQLAALAEQSGSAAVGKRISADQALLQKIATPTAGDWPAEPEGVAVRVQEIDRRLDTHLKLSPAVAALASAEIRLARAKEIAMTLGLVPEISVPLPPAVDARKGLAQIAAAPGGPTANAAALAVASYEDATVATSAALGQIAEPTAAALVEGLTTRQAAYRQAYGGVDLAEVWQPESMPHDLKTPSDLAAPVAAALTYEVQLEPLHSALIEGNTGEAQAVLGHIASLQQAEATLAALRELAEQEGSRGERPLHDAAAAGQGARVASLLALGVTPAPRDALGRTPLGMALAEEHVDVGEQLLEAGGRPTRWMEAGQPIIFLVVTSPRAVGLLLEHGAPAGDLHRGDTALHALAWQANRHRTPAKTQIEAAQLLIEAGVRLGATNRAGQTAAELAQSLGLEELATYLRNPRR